MYDRKVAESNVNIDAYSESGMFLIGKRERFRAQDEAKGKQRHQRTWSNNRHIDRC